MLWVDPREGSAELAKPLRQRGLEVVDDEQIDADVQFTGRGEKGETVEVGIEVKKLSDLVASLQTQRMQGVQLPRMRGVQADGKARYDFAYLLIIENELVYDARGMLMRRSGRNRFRPMNGHMTISELYKRINVLHLQGGLNPMWCSKQRDAIRWIEALYHTFTDTDLDKHKSHLGIYSPPPLVPLSAFQTHLIGGRYPGVGKVVAAAAEKKFKGSIRKAIMASADEWASLETKDEKGHARRFGAKHAQSLVEAFK